MPGYSQAAAGASGVEGATAGDLLARLADGGSIMESADLALLLRALRQSRLVAPGGEDMEEAAVSVASWGGGGSDCGVNRGAGESFTGESFKVHRTNL